MSPHSKSRPRTALTVLVTLVFAALAVWLYIQGSRAAQNTSLPSAETADQELSGIPAWAPEESIANNMGVDFASRGEYEKAIGHFEIAVEANESYLPGHKNLLAAYVETERWGKARGAAEKAEELHPLSEHLQRARPPEDEEIAKELRQESDCIANLGRAYLETGDMALAEDRFTLHLRLRPNELKGYNGLAETAARKGDAERAVQLYAQSLRLYWKQPEVVERLKVLAQDSPELSAKVDWVLRTYAQGDGQDMRPPGIPRPGTPDPGGPRVTTPT